MTRKFNESTRSVLFLFVLLFSFLWHLSNWGVMESSEARYAEIAREMLQTGNWLIPQYLEISHFDKPPMTYWITALGLQLFGVNPFGARFFSQIAFIIQIIILYKIVWELIGDKKLALSAALIYAAMPLVLISIRNLTTDAYLNTFALLAVWFYLRFNRTQSIKWLYLFFTCLGLAIFTKGPFGILLPLLAIHPLRQFQNPHLQQHPKIRIHFYLGTLCCIIIGGWWFFYLMYHSHQFYHFFVGDQLFNRIAHADAMKRNEPFWYYFILLPLFILPVLSLFAGSVPHFFKQQHGQLKWLIGMTILLPLFLFSLSSSKLSLYILPLMPYIAIVTAFYFHQLEERKLKFHFYYTLTFNLLLFTTIILFYLGIFPNISAHPGVFTISLLFLWLFYMGFTVYKTIALQHKILLLFISLPLFVVPISTNILEHAAFSSTVKVTNFIKSKHLENQHLIIWNRAINAIPFELQRKTFSVKYEHYSLQRNTSFQPNLKWKNYLIDIKQQEGLSYLKTLQQSPSLLITRDVIPPQFKDLLSIYNQQKTIGKWTVYFKQPCAIK
ncbi:ArnT family glycosyltransferase [Pedobacter sp.]|uniref:ArnT family glycosyltransferase n=1 Tax=Pedobacter sp. TaxID=1411316 RepID=UPI003D7FD568